MTQLLLWLQRAFAGSHRIIVGAAALLTASIVSLLVGWWVGAAIGGLLLLFGLVIVTVRAHYSVAHQLASHRASTKDQVRRIDAQAKQLSALDRRVVDLQSALGTDPSGDAGLHELLRDLRSRIGHDTRGITQRLDRLSHEPVTEVDALLHLHHRYSWLDPAPLTGGSALSPIGLLQVLDLVAADSPRTIVECGAGASTVFLAAALPSRGNHRMVSLEHLPSVASEVRRVLRRNRLEHRVELRVGDLSPVNVYGEDYPWYPVSFLDDLEDIDFLLVDGPPGSSSSLARLPALPLLADRLSARAVVVLDDAQRGDEREILARWLQYHPLRRTLSQTRHQAVLRWNA